MDSLNLLPQPRQVTPQAGSYRLINNRCLRLDSPNPPALLFTARRVQAALRARFGVNWAISAAPTLPPEQVGLTLRVTGAPLVGGQAGPAQGYELRIGPEGMLVEAASEAGAFYAACTLIQILEQSGPVLPGVFIQDAPDFPARGVMLDVSRDRVPTLETVQELVDMLASWKVNQFQLYTEHTFAYSRHPEAWAHASPFTGDEILRLDAFCRERFVELVPNQNSLGHMERWLRLPRYQPLAEVVGKFMAPWGEMEGPFSLCPQDPGSLELIRGLYDELLPHFTSRVFNVGLDETFDVGQGRSRQVVAERGGNRVYLEYLLQVHREVTARGRIMQFWGDIIVEHPALIPQLPRDSIALEWGYDATHPFDAHGGRFASAGIPFYVCPGTSSWNTIGGRTDNALENLRGAAVGGLKHGAVGYLNTDWGDNGHWQMLPVSYLGFAAGAAYGWSLAANEGRDLAPALSRWAFGDASGCLGKAAYDLGNVYRLTGLEIHNASPLFWMLQWPLELVRGYRDTLAPDALPRVLEALDQAETTLRGAHSLRPDAGLLLRELGHAARLMRHAARRCQLALETPGVSALELQADLEALIREQRALWLERCRPGGLEDSLRRFEPARADYARLAV